MEYGKNKEEYSKSHAKSHAKSLSNTHNQEMRICLFTLFNIISIIKHLCLFFDIQIPWGFYEYCESEGVVIPRPLRNTYIYYSNK